VHFSLDDADSGARRRSLRSDVRHNNTGGRCPRPDKSLCARAQPVDKPM